MKGIPFRYGMREYVYCERCRKYDSAVDYTFNYMDEKTTHYDLIILSMTWILITQCTIEYTIQSPISMRLEKN